ncbi:MAG: glycosyltransferase [Sphingobium sp.]
MLLPLYTLALLCLLAFLHPYLLYPLTLRLMRAQPGERRDGGRPSASLLFAAYNEERVLAAKLANLDAIRALHPDLEILAYSDASTDGTLALLQSRPDLLRVISSPERTGKATGMRRMVAEARGDICIFTDANVLLEPGSVAKLLDHFRDPAIGGVSGTLRYINEGESATAQVGGLYWRLEERIKALESRCGSMMGADGSIFATRRILYPGIPPHLLDDMIASISVIFNGLRLISAPDVVAYERNTTDPADEFRRKRRIACRAWNSHRYLWPRIWTRFSAVDRYKYVSHKLLRWFGAPVLATAGLSLGMALWLGGHHLALALLMGLALACWIAGGLLKIRPFGALWEALRAIFATFLGILDAWSGESYQTWSPAKSRD